MTCWMCHFCSNQRLPPECPSSEENITYIFVDADKKQPEASQTCYNLKSRNDPSLAIMLSQVRLFTLKPEERKIPFYCLLSDSLLLTFHRRNEMWQYDTCWNLAWVCWASVSHCVWWQVYQIHSCAATTGMNWSKNMYFLNWTYIY